MSTVTHDVQRFQLDNGLTVLIKESHASPVAAALAHVNVGYFNEPDRLGGIAHVIEHMLFKGTSRRPGKEQIAEEVRALGGTLNAGTYYEDTSYYVVVPARHLASAVEIQADMLQNSLIDPDELAKELEVIIQESRQKRDNPTAMLIETMYARGFDKHRIRRWRIGEDDTLRDLRSSDLHEFIACSYRPENMSITIVGDVETAAALDLVRRHWDAVPRGALRLEQSPDEPERRGFRYHRMRGDIQQRLLVAGMPAPPVSHPDVPALSVMDALLSDGRSSRLFRSLKEDRRLVNSVWADYEGFRRLGIFMLGGEAQADDPLSAEKGLVEEARRLASEEVGSQELERVKTRMRSRRIYAQEEALGIARNLAWYEMQGDFRLWDDFLERQEAVTPADIQRAAERYIDLSRATVVEYLPSASWAPERRPAELARALGASATAAAARAVRKTAVGEPVEMRLGSGAAFVARRRTDLPLIALHALFIGGRRNESAGNAGITNLMLKSMMKGTESYSAVEIAARIEGLGSGIGHSLTPDYFGFSMKILADRFEEGLAILKEVIGRPTFAPDEVEKEKEAIYAEIRRQQDSMSARAVDLFYRSCFGNTPYGLPGSGIADAVAKLTADDLRSWHDRLLRAGGAYVGLVGDIEPERAAEMLDELAPVGPERIVTPIAGSFAPPGEQSVRIDRQQTAAVMGFRGAAVHEEGRHALDVAAEIASGLAGRFFQAVRGDSALAYAVSASSRARRDAGVFVTYTATSPENELRAREILLDECARLAREPVTAKELADAKSAIRGEQSIHTQTFGAQAGELAAHSLFGLPLDETERYLERIDAVTADEITAAAAHFTLDQAWLGVVRGGAAE